MAGRKLQKYFVNNIVDAYMPSLYQLAASSFQKEMDELKTDFFVLSSEEVYGRGRYILNEPLTMKIVLHNNLMADNVRLVFLASKKGNSLYSRDSIKKDYRTYVSRIQSISFVADYLKAIPDASLDIYYFNNKGINAYNIDNVNKSPVTWARHDKWVEA